MSNEIEITEELKKEILTYWRDTKKDKEALARTADLFGLREEDVGRIIAVRWKEKKKFWDEDRIFRLKAYMAQGLGNMEIAKQLGCKPQAVADFKRRNKDILSAYGEDRNEKFEAILDSVDNGKKKEPSAAGTDESSKKNTDVEVDSSENNYSTDVNGCQVHSDDITQEMYSDLYNRFLNLWSKNDDALKKLYDASLLLKTAKYAGIYWCETHDSYGNELADTCRMYDMLIERAMEAVSGAIMILEDGCEKEKV